MTVRVLYVTLSAIQLVMVPTMAPPTGRVQLAGASIHWIIYRARGKTRCRRRVDRGSE